MPAWGGRPWQRFGRRPAPTGQGSARTNVLRTCDSCGLVLLGNFVSGSLNLWAARFEIWFVSTQAHDKRENPMVDVFHYSKAAQNVVLMVKRMVWRGSCSR